MWCFAGIVSLIMDIDKGKRMNTKGNFRSSRCASLTTLVIIFLGAITGCNDNATLTDENSNSQSGLMAARSVVGGGIYVPGSDLGQPIAEGRQKQVFANLEGDGCIVTDKDYRGDSKGLVHTWTSTKSYYDYVKSDTKISGSLANEAVLKASLDVAASRSVSSKTQIAGSAYEFFAFKQLIALSDDCETGRNAKGKLAPDMMAAFRALPFPVSDPSDTLAWQAYQDFLTTYGSHYVNELKTGTRFRRYTFLQKFKKVEASDLKVAACVAAEGPTPEGNASVNGCQSIDTEKRRKVDLSNYTIESSAYGGNESLRNKLSGGEPVSPALLAELADTADKTQDGVKYTLAPIWKLLEGRAKNTKEKNIANSLKAYFEGFIAFNCNQVHGCGCSRIMDKKKNVLLRKFVQTATNPLVKYECQRPVMGCRNINDCNWNVTKFYCQCYGDHCVNTGSDKISAVVNYSSKIAGKNTGPNKSCYHNETLKSTCSCRRPAKDKLWDTLWSSR